MMEQISSWIEVNQFLAYGILFAYCAGKSGILPFFAGVAANSGLLELASVGFAVFLGGYLGDELRFFIARRYGHKLSFKSARMQHMMRVTQDLMDKYGVGYIFLYRYPKGVRTIGALPLGLTGIAWPYFTILNAASAMLWMGLLVGAGYLFGASLGDSVQNGWSIVSVALLAVFCLAAWLMIRQLRTV